jgi:hypothetical protein
LWDEKRENYIIDEEAAARSARSIFRMTMEGFGPYQIARKLTEQKIEIPSAHLARHGEGVNQKKTFKDIYGWGSSTVVHILKKREYLGHTSNFKTRKRFKDKKSHYVDENEWTIFESAHEPIIDQDTFDNVQRIRAGVRRYLDGWGEAHPLTGLLYCAASGGKMYVRSANNGKRIAQYTCSQYTKAPVGEQCKTQRRINAKANLVTDTLRAIAEYSKIDRDEFFKAVDEAQKRVSELEVLICKIYEDSVLGKLPEARYAALDARYAKEQGALSEEITGLEAAVNGYEKSRKSAGKFIAIVEKYEKFDTLTMVMQGEFVEKILVHERDRKGSVETTQEVEIFFNFVGKYVPPHFGEVNLTSEEQEGIRKREERKDKRRQAYLRRKESGWQRQYENRTKGAKKAAIDEKKDALRTEDISKGVFVPVGHLPKKEPRKAERKAAALPMAANQ